jgi:hypothetical protein
MAWTQVDIDALKAAIKSGVRRVTFGDQTTEYQDTASMIRALRLMEAEVTTAAGTATSGRTILAKHARGV